MIGMVRRFCVHVVNGVHARVETKSINDDLN